MATIPVFPVCSVWIDRLRRRPLLVATNVGCALLMGLIPLASLGHWLSLPLLFGVAMGTGLLTVIFNLSYGSYLTTLVPRADLLAGNSAMQVSASLAKVSGPSMAGVLVQVMSAPLTFVVDVISFVVATGSLLTIRARETPLPSTHVHPPFWSALRFGMRVTLRQPLMRAMASMACVYNLCVIWRIFCQIQMPKAEFHWDVAEISPV